MTELKTLNSVTVGEEGVQRLFHMTRESRLKPDCTLFEAGYEQAKRDFREALYREVGVPSDQLSTRVNHPSPEMIREQAIREAGIARKQARSRWILW